MSLSRIALTLVSVCFISATLLAQAAASAPSVTSAPSAAPASKPAASAPASKPVLVATVGTVEIMSDRVDNILARAPRPLSPEEIPLYRTRIISNLIQQELVRQFIASKKVAVSPEDLKSHMDELAKAASEQKMTPEQFMAANNITENDIKTSIQADILAKAATSKDKIDALIKAHPEYFNGTKVKASHVLIAALLTDSTEKQKAALAKAEQLAADIKAGKITFEQAADQNNPEKDPSRGKGGDLGEMFTFGQMVPEFAVAAFAAKKGDVTGVVRSPFGFHLIKITDRVEGKDEPSPTASADAGKVLMSQLQEAVSDMAMTTVPIVVK